MIANQFRNQCKTQAGSVPLCRHKRVEQVGTEILRYTVAVVLHADQQREVYATLDSGYRQTDAMLVGSAQNYLTALFRNSFCRIFNQVEEHLDELVPVAIDVRKGWIVPFGETDSPREAALGDFADMFQDAVDVDRCPVGR